VRADHHKIESRFTPDHGCKRLLSFEGYEDIRTAIAQEKQLKGWRREKELNLIRTINPEFKDLGMVTITMHETDVPVIIKCVSQQILLSGFGG
jgi:predicted GIY-YIG superfamily endonuclease